MPDSDLTPLSARRREIYDGLTSWAPELRNDNESATLITVEGATIEDALFKANDLFILNRWGDGLPLWPASQERVDWILRGTDLPRDHLLGKFPPRGGLATVEACAVALAMAGGRPEYLPVLIASVEALLDPARMASRCRRHRRATFPVIIVNGPIAKQIRLNSGFGCLGPDPQHPAGASIGRALRQMQQNLGGAQPGTGTMAPWGAMRTTNVVFAEDEDGLPEGWLPHGTQRHGFAPGTNSISFFWATGATNICGAAREGDARGGRAAGPSPDGRLSGRAEHSLPHGYDDGTPGAVLLTQIVADYLASTGWTQGQDPPFPVGEFEDSRRRRCAATAAAPGSTSRRRTMARESIEARSLADRLQARKHHPGGGGRRPSDSRVLDAGLLARCRRTRDQDAGPFRRTAVGGGSRPRLRRRRLRDLTEKFADLATSQRNETETTT